MENFLGVRQQICKGIPRFPQKLSFVEEPIKGHYHYFYSNYKIGGPQHKKAFKSREKGETVKHT